MYIMTIQTDSDSHRWYLQVTHSSIIIGSWNIHSSVDLRLAHFIGYFHRQKASKLKVNMIHPK